MTTRAQMVDVATQVSATAEVGKHRVTGTAVTRGLIYNSCVHSKWGFKLAHATFYANVGICKNKLNLRMCALVRKL